LYYGNFDLKPIVGKTYKVRFKENPKQEKASFYKINSIRNSKEKISTEILKPVSGKIEIHKGNSFGFVNNIFIPPYIINKYHLHDKEIIDALAIQKYSKKRKSWAWNVAKIEK
ncbi:MAG: hypothetical protein U9R32_09100, partial [Bacteroidota bacterium]|nr:hypothetical protein [Bacteroidota bacterium]